MEPSELLQLAAEMLERLGVEYLVTGSMASIAYGEPRFTNDIDIVVRLTTDQAAVLCEDLVPRGFYVSLDAARAAIKHRGQFNAIHPASGLKIDFMVAADDDFNRSRFTRARRLQISDDHSASFAAPEDVILRKLEYYREGGSDKHLRDIRGILSLLADAIDEAHLSYWIDRLNVRAEWDAARQMGEG